MRLESGGDVCGCGGLSTAWLRRISGALYGGEAMNPIIQVCVVILGLFVIYLVLGLLHITEPSRSVVLALSVVLGILYLLGLPPFR